MVDADRLNQSKGKRIWLMIIIALAGLATPFCLYYVLHDFSFTRERLASAPTEGADQFEIIGIGDSPIIVDATDQRLDMPISKGTKRTIKRFISIRACNREIDKCSPYAIYEYKDGTFTHLRDADDPMPNPEEGEKK